MPAAAQAFPFRKRLHIGASLVAPLVVLWWASRRGWVAVTPWWCLVAIPVAVLIGMMLPKLFAGWYRIFSAIQSWIGRQILALLLGLIFVLVLIPVGLCLRARGKSFLGGPPAASYWKPARKPGSLKHQY